MDAAVNANVRASFQRALLETKLYAATPNAPDVAEERSFERGENVALLNVQSPDGKPVTPVFTAQERISEVFGMNTGFIEMQGEALLSMVASQGAWLNPGFPYNVYWKPNQLHSILGMPVMHTLKKETQILLGCPAEQPTKLIHDLKAALASDKRVKEAWLALAHWPESH